MTPSRAERKDAVRASLQVQVRENGVNDDQSHAPGSKAARKQELLRKLAEAQAKISEAQSASQVTPSTQSQSTAARKKAAAQRLRERLDDSVMSIVNIGDIQSSAIRRKHIRVAQLRAQQATREAQFAKEVAEHDAELRDFIEQESSRNPKLQQLDDALLAKGTNLSRAERKRRLMKAMMEEMGDGVALGGGGEANAVGGAELKAQRRKDLLDRFAAQQKAHERHMIERLRARGDEEDAVIEAVEAAMAAAVAASTEGGGGGGGGLGVLDPSRRRSMPAGAIEAAVDPHSGSTQRELRSTAARKQRVAAELRAALSTEHMAVVDVGNLMSKDGNAAARAARKAEVRARAFDALAKADAAAAAAAAAYDRAQAAELSTVDRAAAAVAEALAKDASIPRHVRKRKVAELLARDQGDASVAVEGHQSGSRAQRKARLAAKLRAEADREEARWREEARATRAAERAAVAQLHREMELLNEAAAALSGGEEERQKMLRDGYAALLQSSTLASEAAAEGAAGGDASKPAGPSRKSRKAALRAALEAQVAAHDAALVKMQSGGAAGADNSAQGAGDDVDITPVMAAYLDQHAAAERRLRAKRRIRAKRMSRSGRSGGSAVRAGADGARSPSPSVEEDGGDGRGGGEKGHSGSEEEDTRTPEEVELAAWKSWLEEFGLKADAPSDEQFGLAAYRRWHEREEARFRALQAELTAWAATAAALEAELADLEAEPDEDGPDGPPHRRWRREGSEEGSDGGAEQVERSMLAAAGYQSRTPPRARSGGVQRFDGKGSKGFDLEAHAQATAEAAASRRRKGGQPGSLFDASRSEPVPLETGRGGLSGAPPLSVGHGGLSSGSSPTSTFLPSIPMGGRSPTVGAKPPEVVRTLVGCRCAIVLLSSSSDSPQFAPPKGRTSVMKQLVMN